MAIQSHQKKFIVHVAVNDLAVKSKDGGHRRTVQIAELASADATFLPLKIKHLSTAKLFQYLLRGIFHVPPSLSLKGRLRAAITIGGFLQFLSDRCLELSKTRFILEMSFGPSQYVGYFLACQGADYVVFPHNIEFMVPGQNSIDCSAGTSFELERSVYRKAHHTFCISNIDSHIVECLGASARTLHYFPQEMDHVRFKNIAHARLLHREDNHLLYIGTVHNPPTRQGLEILLRQFESIFEPRWHLTVAGFGTEALKNFNSKRINIIGSVSDKQLDQLLTRARAALIYQPPTTGFLTRLVEFNLCKLPVFINSEYLPAAGLEKFGIFTYQNLSQIEQALDKTNDEIIHFAKPCPYDLLYP